MEIKTNNYLFLDDFLQICRNNKDKAIMLNVDDDNGSKIIPLNCGHYIEDEIWFIQVNLDKTETNNHILGIDFIGECEDEALSDDWGGLYQSPMEHLGNCEIRFCTGFGNKTYFDEFAINNIIITDNEIIINLKYNKIGGNM